MGNDNTDTTIVSGGITFVRTKRRDRPSNLYKPYEYGLSVEGVMALFNGLKDCFTKFGISTDYVEHVWHGEPCGKYQGTPKLGSMYFCAERKKRGVRLFVSFSSDASGPDVGRYDGYVGMGGDEWDGLTGVLQGVLFEYLGQDAKAYVDDYCDGYSFNFIFETYIQYV